MSDDDEDNEILASLQESMDYSGGFVSSFTLPLSLDDEAGEQVPTISNSLSNATSPSIPPTNPLPPLKSPQQLSPLSTHSQNIFRSPKSNNNLSPSLSYSPTPNNLEITCSFNNNNSTPPPPPPDLLSPRSIGSEGTELVCNINASETSEDNSKKLKMQSRAEDDSKKLSPFQQVVSCPSLDTVNTHSSTPPRSGNKGADVRDCYDGSTDEVKNCSSTSSKTIDITHQHDSKTGKINKSTASDKKNSTNKRKKIKPSTRKNNLVILPWNAPFPRTNPKPSDAHYSNNSPSSSQQHQKSPSSLLPPPHPLSHVQSYPPITNPSHPHYVQASHRYPQHVRSYSFASDASSSEATPITCPANNLRRDKADSIDESLDAANVNDVLHDVERGNIIYDRQISDGADTNGSDPYFQDFDDTLSKDSVNNNRDGDLIGVNIHMDYDRSKNEAPISVVNVVPQSISTNSLLGLDIPTNNQQQKKHQQRSSLEYSPATLVTFADAVNTTSSIPLIPVDSHPPPTSNIQYHQDETDDGSTLSNPVCSVLDETPPTSPNPYLHKSPTKRHHKHRSSLVSCSESCLQSQCSLEETQSMFDFPNPDPQLIQVGLSPLDSASSFEEDRSLCAEEKAFVQQIHNSGLSSLSFEHVEDVLDNTSMDVEMELVFNSGSFDNGSVDGSVESASVMSVEEKKEMERRIYCYRKFREKRSKMSDVRSTAASSVKSGAGSDSKNVVLYHEPITPGIPATPIASNKAPQSTKSPEMDAIDVYNQECDDGLEALEMIPLAKTTNSSNIENELNGSRLDFNETKIHPNNNPGWRPYYFLRNLIWWWQLQPSSFSNSRFYESKRQKSKKDYSSNGFDDIDFDRNSSPCPSFCSSKTFWYMQTGWSKLFLIACFFLLLGWIFSDDGLQKHQSQESYYANVHRTKHGYHLYGRDDPLAKEAFVPPKRIIDDTDDFVNPMSRPEDDDIDFSVVERYFPTESQPIAELDDVFKRFEMEDDIFDSGLVIQSDETNGDSTRLKEAANSILSGFDNQEPFIAIDTIVVLGERHVGIEWLVGKLKVLYPNLDVSSGFPSENRIDGMWFQPEEDIESISVSKHILVIALFINPYDWVELMHVDPIYAPNHKAMGWKEFLEAEWTPINQVDNDDMENELDAAMESPRMKKIVDDDGADWDDRVPDNKATSDDRRNLDSYPKTSRYEFKMGGSEYYSSILELRADKIRAAVKGSLYIPGVFTVIPVRYEDLVEPYMDNSSHLPGIIGLVARIQSLTGITPDAELDKSFFPDPIGCNGHICHPSVNKMRQNVDYISYLNSHVDWHAEQLMGYQKMSFQKPSVERIVVLGERHSRAEWLIDRLSRCFPDIELTYGFNNRPGKFFQSPPVTDTTRNTLVIALFINAYSWVEQMRLNPINAPAHVGMEWEDFVTSPWQRTRSNLDSVVVDTWAEICSFNFSYHEIIPCHTQRDPDSADFPLYELQHPFSDEFDANNDRAYSNLLELRADKIQNFLSTAHFPGVVNLIKLRYEDLVWDGASYTDDESYLTLPFPGIAGLLETIRDRTTLTPDVNAGWILDESGFFKAEPLGDPSWLDQDYKFLEKLINWSVEALIGYGS